MGEEDKVKAEDSNSTTNIPNEADPSLYTWSSFFSLFKGQATQKDVDRYFAARDLAREEKDCKKCNKNVAWLLQNSM